jgi:DNA-directed RNA polymerase specialized sigma24 family protein
LDITQEAFNDLLTWLNPDRELAGRKYETIRAGLIRVFVAKGFAEAEDMADEAITRVNKRLPDIVTTYVGEPALYFHGVARNLIREAVRRKEVATDLSPVASIQITNQSDEYECLMRCLQFLDRDKRELILDYHVYERRDKIEHHRVMAAELGISETALRCRTHRIRTELEECVLDCVQSLKKQNAPSQHSN